MKSPKRKDGDPVSEVAALCVSSQTEKPDVSGEAVNAAQMIAWIDEAIFTLRRASSDPVEFQRLGLWLQRMRRALQ
jgi:hypothetical protein